MLTPRVPLGARRAPYQAISSGLLDASGVVYAGQALLVACIVYPGGADCTATVADGENGKVLALAKGKADDLPGGETHIFSPAETGLHLTLTGTGAAALVRYVALPEI